jgi:hypothetical protein
MQDNFADRSDSVSAPATRAQVIMPDDATPLSSVPKALYIGNGGDIAMRGAGDTADSVWRNVPSGAVLPFRALYVRATGTTADAMLALY